MNERGVIAHVERRQQLLDMRDLRIGNITPTDVDGLIEYRGQAFVLFEVKWRTAELSRGQSTALERLIDAVQKGGTPSCLFVAEHTVDDCGEQVDAALCLLRNYYYRGQWRHNHEPGTTLKRAILGFLKVPLNARDVEVVRVRQDPSLDTGRLGVTVNQPVTAPGEHEINW